VEVCSYFCSELSFPTLYYKWLQDCQDMPLSHLTHNYDKIQNAHKKYRVPTKSQSDSNGTKHIGDTEKVTT
jgi:hypothetical protein